MGYLLILGAIAIGATLLLIYYSVSDKKKKKDGNESETKDDKGKVIYLFDDEKEDSGFVDPKPEKPKDDPPKDSGSEEPTKKDD